MKRILVAAAIALALPAAAQATTNVVPNPGFEQGGCSSTPIICGWLAYGLMSQDTADAHSGNSSMALSCGNTGCDPGGGGWASIWAETDPAFCAAIGPGAHPASFWSRDAVGFVSLRADFYEGPDCTGWVGWGSFGDRAAAAGW